MFRNKIVEPISVGPGQINQLLGESKLQIILFRVPHTGQMEEKIIQLQVRDNEYFNY